VNVLDLFSGIGGFSLGLERAGFKTIAFCEIDPFCRKVLNKHWPDVPIYEDIRELDGSTITADVITGGFPCQDLSSAGLRKGFHGERSSLYREMLRIISECGPQYAIFENVTGLLSGNTGEWFAAFLYDLASIGYDAEWHCISASFFGACHHRDRVWVIAYPTIKPNDGKSNDDRGGIFGQSIWALQPRRQTLSSIKKTWDITDRSILESAFCGEDAMLSGGVERLKQYGNTVFPVIPEIIGRAIMANE